MQEQLPWQLVCSVAGLVEGRCFRVIMVVSLDDAFTQPSVAAEFLSL